MGPPPKLGTSPSQGAPRWLATKKFACCSFGWSSFERHSTWTWATELFSWATNLHMCRISISHIFADHTSD